jgi:hypothetical protein
MDRAPQKPSPSFGRERVWVRVGRENFRIKRGCEWLGALAIKPLRPTLTLPSPPIGERVLLRYGV